ncbi:unnamed protein product [Effrenium voratum]|nr:unnamed protein product [Effrenium voratum]
MASRRSSQMPRLLPLLLAGAAAFLSAYAFIGVRRALPSGRFRVVPGRVGWPSQSGARDVARPAFPRANPGGEAEKMRIARYEKEEEAMAVVKKAEEEAKDPDGTSEEKTKAYGILFAYALAFMLLGRTLAKAAESLALDSGRCR